MPDDMLLDFSLENVVDIKLDEAGDIVVDQYGNIELVHGEDAVIQGIIWRIRTELGDWRLEPDCGTRLWMLAGAPNSPETGELIRAEVHRALTHDGYIPDALLMVDVAPESEDAVSVFILIDGLTRAVKFIYHLQRGAVTDWQFIQLIS